MTAAFKPMLAKDPAYDEAGDPIIAYPVAVQPKIDGIRASVVGGKLVSRTLKPIPNAEIRAALEHPEFEGLDGELIVGSSTAEDCYRRTSSFVTAPSKTGEPWTFQVFDKWDAAGGFQDRHAAIYEALTGTHHKGRIKVVTTALAVDASHLRALEELTLAQGGEGIIARDPSAPYKFGRSGKKGPLIKIKRFIDFEATVIGVYEEQHNGNEAVTNALGRTERSTKQAGKVGKGTLGGLVLRALNGPAEGIEFRCGTGFDRDQRRDLWAEAGLIDCRSQGGSGRDGLTGRVAKIKSFPIGVKDKPRHPVFLGWRDLSVDG